MSVWLGWGFDNKRGMMVHTSSSHLPALKVIMGEMDMLDGCWRSGVNQRVE